MQLIILDKLEKMKCVKVENPYTLKKTTILTSLRNVLVTFVEKVNKNIRLNDKYLSNGVQRLCV